MSTKSKLLSLTEGLQLPLPPTRIEPSENKVGEASQQDDGAQRFPPVVPGRSPRTGPGHMLQFRGQILAAEGELGKLREQLKEHDGAVPTKKLDPGLVRPSHWANRHNDSFSSPEYARLKQDIEQAGGNVQAISVRPLAGGSGQYEIIFGHRRHRACSELGLPVLATIDTSTISDLELFSAMDRENRERADLSPYEQGTMYRRALDEGLYPSNRRLAEALGVSHTWVANVIQVAELPPGVVECFRSPLEIQHRHAKALGAALDSDRKGVLRRAEKLRQQDRKQSAAGVVDVLTAASPKSSKSKPAVIEFEGKPVGTWFKDEAGRLNIQLNPNVASVSSPESLASLLARVLCA